MSDRNLFSGMHLEDILCNFLAQKGEQRMRIIESTDRYGASGIPYPDPVVMCEGPCEGIGVYPENDTSAAAWQIAHAKAHNEPCDGWHFVTCQDCGGTGKRR